MAAILSFLNYCNNRFRLASKINRTMLLEDLKVYSLAMEIGEFTAEKFD